MSTARKVLMIIAFIASLFALIGFGICAIVFFAAMNNEEILEKVMDGLNRSSYTIEEAKNYMLALGITFSIFTLFELLNACLSIKAVKSSRAGLMILNIVFGFLSGIYINILGGIFGLVDGKKD